MKKEGIEELTFQLLYRPAYHHPQKEATGWTRLVDTIHTINSRSRRFWICDCTLEGCLLASSFWKQDLVRFMVSYLCEENLLFFDEVEKFRANPTPSSAITIYSKFLSEASQFEVNIPGSPRKKIGTSIRGLLKKSQQNSETNLTTTLPSNNPSSPQTQTPSSLPSIPLILSPDEDHQQYHDPPRDAIRVNQARSTGYLDRSSKHPNSAGTGAPKVLTRFPSTGTTSAMSSKLKSAGSVGSLPKIPRPGGSLHKMPSSNSVDCVPRLPTGGSLGSVPSISNNASLSIPQLSSAQDLRKLSPLVLRKWKKNIEELAERPPENEESKTTTRRRCSTSARNEKKWRGRKVFEALNAGEEVDNLADTQVSDSDDTDSEKTGKEQIEKTEISLMKSTSDTTHLTPVQSNLFDSAQILVVKTILDTFSKFKKNSIQFKIDDLSSWWTNECNSFEVLIAIFFDPTDIYFDKYFLKAWCYLVEEIRLYNGDICAISCVPQKKANEIKILYDLNYYVIGDEESLIAKQLSFPSSKTGLVLLTHQSKTIHLVGETNVTESKEKNGGEKGDRSHRKEPNIHESQKIERKIEKPKTERIRTVSISDRVTTEFALKVEDFSYVEYPDPNDVWHRYKLSLEAQSVLDRRENNVRRGCPFTGIGWIYKNPEFYYRKPIEARGCNIMIKNGFISFGETKMLKASSGEMLESMQLSTGNEISGSHGRPTKTDSKRSSWKISKKKLKKPMTMKKNRDDKDSEENQSNPTPDHYHNPNNSREPETPLFITSDTQAKRASSINDSLKKNKSTPLKQLGRSTTSRLSPTKHIPKPTTTLVTANIIANTNTTTNTNATTTSTVSPRNQLLPNKKSEDKNSALEERSPRRPSKTRAFPQRSKSTPRKATLPDSGLAEDPLSPKEPDPEGKDSSRPKRKVKKRGDKEKEREKPREKAIARTESEARTGAINSQRSHFSPRRSNDDLPPHSGLLDTSR
eukprot:TRINITY_DN2533_c0_g2_i1.p1 TRINITY_DN2533_c0_g2~~TRINITY_DN2533_c0_g2_i1.p1  ORF type:complete len:1072 (-),score=272.91 TRINITY_DN2533_c0_g2_i1:3-2921(-)